MLILYDRATLLHRTVELLGAKLIPAHESPERIEAILAALERQTPRAHELCEIQSLNGEEEQGQSNSPAPTDTSATGSATSTSKHPSHLSTSTPTSLQLLRSILSETHSAAYLEHLRTAHSTWVSQDLIAPSECILPECFPIRAVYRNAAHSSPDSPKDYYPPPPKDIFARVGYYAFDMSAALSKDTWKSAMASANLAVQAARALFGRLGWDRECEVEKKPRREVLALCRPPGHHCTTEMAGGYCYINNAVVAVHALRRFHAKTRSTAPSFAILDLDFHHGNGTQDSFYSDPSVLYASVHGEDEFPYYSGASKEIGEGDGKGFNFNIPLRAGSSFRDYTAAVQSALSCIEEHGPDYLIISLGFDTFRLDPLGSFDIDSDDYAAIAKQVASAPGLENIPVLILLEGGYVVEKLGENLLSFLGGWKARPT